jgi:hypothetical protein
MKTRLVFSAVILLSCLAFSLSASAVNDNKAPVVKLRAKNADGMSGCVEGGVTLNNCFNGLTGLQNWITSTRQPNAANPLIVDIGPGTFSDSNGAGFTCTTGYITLRGAGRSQTTIQGGTTGSGCPQFNVQDLTISGGLIAIQWAPDVSNPSAKSTWTNVDVINTNTYGWEDVSGSGGTCTTQNRPQHFWFNSRIFVRNSDARAYSATCSDNWFFGSEVIANTYNDVGLRASAVRGYGATAGFHFYGSHIDAESLGSTMPEPGFNSATPGDLVKGVVPVAVDGGATIHIHGTGIDSIGSGSYSVAALLARGSGSFIHANGTAYMMQTLGGSLFRIINADGVAHIHAPYLWEHIPTSPLVSVTGADTTTVTTGTSDGHPHFVISDTSCSSGWYDTVDKACH